MKTRILDNATYMKSSRPVLKSINKSISVDTIGA